MDGDRSYSGNSSHIYVERLLKSGGDLSIISPYISVGYLKMLFKLSKRKKVRLIISKSAANREALDYIKRKFGRHIAYAKTSLFFAVISVISFVIRFYYAFLFCIAITAIFAALSTLFYKRRGFKNLQIRVSDEVFIHEKIYINEYAAVTGSANLTYNGLYKNIEHIDLTNNPDKVAALKKHFDRIWPQLKPLA